MTGNFRLISFLLVCVVFASCAKSAFPPKTDHEAIIPVTDEVRKYKLKMRIINKQFSGILLSRKMGDGEIRILASTIFGLSLFDFGLKGEDWHVYSCIEPMRKEKLLKILEADFKLLFLKDRDIKKVEKKEKCTKFVSGSGFFKSVIRVSPAVENNTERIQIRHPWLRLTIELDKLSE